MTRVAIIGLGLIGGSLGLAFCHAGRDIRVEGADLNRDTEKRALAMGCVHAVGEVEEIASRADFVFLCTTLSAMPGLVRRLIPVCPDGCVITDVGSTKQGMAGLFKSLPERLRGIGGHPMAGSEEKGLAGADRYLLENAVYVLTPDEDCPRQDVERLLRLLEGIGVHVVLMDAVEHDRVVAAVSHLPHLAACCLTGMLKGEESSLLLAAGGFRDTTRIAGGDPELWTDILFSNREWVIERLEAYCGLVQRVRDMLDTDRREELRDFLASARQIRSGVPQKNKGLLPSMQDVICLVPDRPGIIGALGRWLGEKGINIADIEILRVREGDGGTIRLGVASREEADRAVTILEANGVKAWLK